MVLGNGFQRFSGLCDLLASCRPPHLHQDLFVLALFLSGFWVVSLPLFELVILSGWSFWLENIPHMSSCLVAEKANGLVYELSSFVSPPVFTVCCAGIHCDELKNLKQ
ncbi:hypothetical protein ISN44_As13g001610 [Arabidopsis suecica]|uniref:Uncharacterized protein n=1 Tax=Arabidopsis suecica TaxID=45249 RepID=A0A8T1XNG5_ARASU|nr:hypothetical protein ISN44_As13g001610 [Arabidopsis suecica]